MIRWSFIQSLSAALSSFLVLLAGVMVVPGAARAADAPDHRPFWSIEVKGGVFYPAFDSFPGGMKWSDFYGKDYTSQFSGAVGFKPLRWLEVGLEGGKIADRGRGYAPVNKLLAGRVVYELYPLSAYVLLRGIFDEQQWIVPFIGGGYTRMFYREKIEMQGTVRGSADGYLGRAGLQLLLDDLDRKSANSLYLDYGIVHTYIVFEAQLTRAETETTSGEQIDLGGISYLGGLLFEF